ncbi:hypothetical protein RFI_11904 [Reticulomyxa filosa]|uniref:Kelch motif family protein n=1 Tax=Reticulomyxa filosa TaxID=46433 RepID=X6NH59_RETFI|nr:hypothetical protein RFI_11904 [Reticulomyxa filosa]|eukprot:ETO25233.1 hypothetical protein RFI_11904 [Reticulomyxa filosa]
MSATNSGFEKLANLPTTLSSTQCVLFEKELLICGGFLTQECYSYHLKKDRYKKICDYPETIEINGHAVVQVKKSKMETTLLSFGGSHNHTLVMKYQSVWNKSKKVENQWIALTIDIGIPEDDMQHVRASVDRKRSLLFIVHPPNHMKVLSTNSLQLKAKTMLPIDNIVGGSCFVSLSAHAMFFFNRNSGLRITYHQTHSSFEYKKLPICDDLHYALDYSFVFSKGYVVLFGGYRRGDTYSNSIFLYSVHTNEWKRSPFILPTPVHNTFAIINDNKTHIHVMGGYDGTNFTEQHLRIDVASVIGIV